MGDEIYISSGSLRIEKNFITDDEILLQISNISDIKVMEKPKTKFYLWTIVLLIIGVLLCLMVKINILYFAIGLYFVSGELAYVITIVVLNSSRKKEYLCISMNSGRNYIMFCQSEAFLKK